MELMETKGNALGVSSMNLKNPIHESSNGLNFYGEDLRWSSTAIQAIPVVISFGTALIFSGIFPVVGSMMIISSAFLFNFAFKFKGEIDYLSMYMDSYYDKMENGEQLISSTVYKKPYWAILNPLSLFRKTPLIETIKYNVKKDIYIVERYSMNLNDVICDKKIYGGQRYYFNKALNGIENK